MPSDKLSCHCPSKSKQKAKRDTYPLWSGILIALIPKCPYCILAYSSAITMCSGTKMYAQTPGWTAYLPFALAVLTLVLVLLNYKGSRTLASAGLVILGSILMIAGEFWLGEILLYYLGTAVLLFGIWVNASFRYFYQKWFLPVLTNLFPSLRKKMSK